MQLYKISGDNTRREYQFENSRKQIMKVATIITIGQLYYFLHRLYPLPGLGYTLLLCVGKFQVSFWSDMGRGVTYPP